MKKEIPGEPPEVTRDSEGNETAAIFIRKSDYRRLDGDESKGPWYKHIKYSTSPSLDFNYKTMAPKMSLRDGIFNPALSNPDEIVEQCEKVPAKEIKKAEKEIAKKVVEKTLSFKKGQIVWYQLSIAGYTTHEEALVGTVSKKKGIFYLDNGDGNDPSGPYLIKNGRLVDESASNMLGSRVRILTEKPKDFHPEE